MGWEAIADIKGPEGDSAYEVAVTNGFVGTKTEWIESLKVKGDTGPANSLSIGEVVTGTPETPASASVTGVPPNQTLDLVIPRGTTGADSTVPGPPGADSTVPGPPGTKGDKGDKGDPGNPTAFELRGTGNPNGAVTASPGTYYTDTAGTNGAWRWVKTSGIGNTGWAVVMGDTGWRNMPGLGAGTTGGSVFWRRVGNIETTQFRGLAIVPTSTSDNIYAPPAGFGPENPSATTQLYRDNGAEVVIQHASWRGFWRQQSNLTTNGLQGDYSEPVTRAWPTVLPGTPA